MAMGISLVLAVTDNDWFDQLRHRPNLEEVNFWSPSPKRFLSLDRGELLLFKLRAPRNAIAGCGVFAHTNTLPCSLAWSAFGAANGTRSSEEMRKRIAKYRRTGPDDQSDFPIGCRILTQPAFFEESDWIPVPGSWSPRIVDYKTYNTSEPEGLHLWEAVTARMRWPSEINAGLPFPRFGKPQLIKPRLGQGAFRIVVTDSYERRCAVTRERTLPVLEAAHIKPYAQGGGHDPRNGLLLRSDIHQLFDSGYVTVTPKLHFEVSSRIREEFENGKDYYALHGKRILIPESANARPDPVALDWHNQNCFR